MEDVVRGEEGGQRAEGLPDLVRLAATGTLPPAYLRDADADALLRALGQRRSVLLVGPDGVGRTTVVRAAARARAARGGPPIVQLTADRLLTGGPVLESVLRHVAERGGSLYVPDVGRLPRLRRDTGVTALDLLRPWVEAGQLTVIGEASPAQVRVLERTPHLVDWFVQQAVEPLPPAQVDEVLARAAADAGLELCAASRRALATLTERFLPARPQPGPALDLIARVKDYQQQKAGVDEHEAASPEFIARVFSIYSGVPRFVVDRGMGRTAASLRAWLAERVVGQHEAVEAVVEAASRFQSGLHDPHRPLGTFLFAGPLGVGRTTLARALATLLFGSAERLLRLDLGDLQAHDALERLLGSPERPHDPALLVDGVRAHPLRVVQLDRLERAPGPVIALLRTLLDEGRVVTLRGEVLDLRRCFVVCTSDVGASEGLRALTAHGEEVGARRRRVLAALERTLPADLLARFDHVVPFHALEPAQLRLVARRELRDVLRRDGITSRNLAVDVDDAALDLVTREGFDPRWGARGLAGAIRRRVVLPLATTLMEHRVAPGEVLRVTGAGGRIRVRRLDPAEGPDAPREAHAIHLSHASRLTPSRLDVEQALARARADVEALHLDVRADVLARDLAQLLQHRASPDFWLDQDQAARDLRELDRLTHALDRLEHLRTRADALADDLARSPTPSRLVGLARHVVRLTTTTADARRELVLMGPDGAWDALLEVRPLAGGRAARDFLTRMYAAWADHRGLEVVWLHEPLVDDDPTLLALRGAHAHGFLRLEAGVHRVRDGDVQAAARVRVAPWTDRARPAVFLDHRALKAIGAFGGRIRSRLACEGGLVLQNPRTLAENRDLALELVGSWADAPPPRDRVVRRYDLVAPLVHDVLTGEVSEGPDATRAERLHLLLCRRVDVDGQGPEAA